MSEASAAGAGECRPAAIKVYRTAAEMIAADPEPTEHYLAHGAILLEDSGIAFDEEFVHRLTFPPEWKKFGTLNDMTVPPIVYAEGRFRRTQNPLCRLIKEDWMLMKTYSELLRLETGFKLLVADLFPRFRHIEWANCTFRFTRTENEGPHVDTFREGKPFPEEAKLPRVKFFLNVDAQPRIWNVGPTLPDLLRASRGALGSALPGDLNVLCHAVNASGFLEGLEYARIEIPPRGIVFANGATVVHQVLFGQRMVALEGFVPRAHVGIAEWDLFPEWIRAGGYAVAPVAVQPGG